MRNRILSLPREKQALLPFQSGVSLHGHTCHSSENLGFIARFLEERSYTRAWLKAQRERGKGRTGISVDLERAYWTPPLDEQQAYTLEARQIEALDLQPLVSLSDHDTTAACTLLRQQPAFRDTPISTEWTVPFGKATFHIGVHNLPAEFHGGIMAALREATAAADDEVRLRLLLQLHELPDVLLVFNHPLWNFNGIAQDLFASTLRDFLQRANPVLHAFELNGMRNHRENSAVIDLAATWKQVLVAGGDRHGCEPNALLNLTAATDLPEFVEEVRQGKQSTVLVMPQYAQPLRWRLYEAFTQIVNEYPDHPVGRQFWDERVFHPDLDGNVVPVVNLWHLGPPGFLKKIFAAAIFGADLPFSGLLHSLTSREKRALFLPSAEPHTSFQLTSPALRGDQTYKVPLGGQD